MILGERVYKYTTTNRDGKREVTRHEEQKRKATGSTVYSTVIVTGHRPFSSAGSRSVPGGMVLQPAQAMMSSRVPCISSFVWMVLIFAAKACRVVMRSTMSSSMETLDSHGPADDLVGGQRGAGRLDPAMVTFTPAGAVSSKEALLFLKSCVLTLACCSP